MYEKLKREWENNPLLVLTIGSFAVASAAKLIDALSVAQGRRAYAKQINYKVGK